MKLKSPYHVIVRLLAGPLRWAQQLLPKAFLLFALAAFHGGHSAYSQSNNIKNDIFWDTEVGKPIYSRDGGIFRFKDPETGKEQSYWYGVRYEGSERCLQDPFVTQDRGSRFNSVTCYTSTDLANWASEGDVLTRDVAQKNGRTGWLSRLGVAYIEETEKYVMVIQHGHGVLFAVANEPAGPFEWNHRKDLTETIGTPNTGDQTVFTDPDTGKSYLVYSYGRGRNKFYVSEIGLMGDQYDLLDCTQVYRGSGRKGVIGKRSLNLGDQVDFKRKVSQEIASSPHVECNDGTYVLTAKLKNSQGFDRLEAYAESGGERFATGIEGENTYWTTVCVEGVQVVGNKVEIGFLAEGESGSFCRVDDVSLVKGN